MAIHPIGIPCKLKLRWNGYNVLVYEDQIVHFNRADRIQFLTKSYNGHFCEILDDLDEAVQSFRQQFGLE